jgi:hypothetical protein
LVQFDDSVRAYLTKLHDMDPEEMLEMGRAMMSTSRGYKLAMETLMTIERDLERFVEVFEKFLEQFFALTEQEQMECLSALIWSRVHLKFFVDHKLDEESRRTTEAIKDTEEITKNFEALKKRAMSNEARLSDLEELNRELKTAIDTTRDVIRSQIKKDEEKGK